MSFKSLTPEQALALGIYPERLSVLDKKLASYVEDGLRQCIAVKALFKGVPVFEGSYGPMGPEEDAPEINCDSIMQVASVTKPVVATLLMQLQEDGALSLHHSVSDYLPYFSEGGRKDINFIHLLTHSSGLVDEELSNSVKEHVQSLGVQIEKDASYEQWVDALVQAREILKLPEIENREEAAHETHDYIKHKVPLQHKPKELMSYCNTGYQLLLKAVAEIYKQPVEEIAQQKIFKPLGMINTHFVVPEEKWKNIVRRKEGMAGYPWYNQPDSYKSESGSGGLKSTANDMLKFCEMIRLGGSYNGARILSRISVEAMAQDYNFNMPSPFDSWALGFNYRGKKLDDTGILRPATCLDHGGFGGTKIIIDAKNELSIAIFGVNNTVPTEQNRLWAITNILYSALV